MSQFTVICSNEAEDLLTDLWLRATDRAAVTAAQHRIEQDLAVDPRGRGREVSEGLWRIDHAPLKVLYEINDARREVCITGIDRLASI